MTQVSPSQSQPGTEIKASNINDPVNQITAVVNGNLDDSNIASISGSKVANGSLPATAIAPGSITPTEMDLSTSGKSMWWEEIGRTTLSTPSDTISVSNLPARKHLKIIIFALNTGGTIGLQMRFNNDSTAGAYARRESNNGAADTTGTGTVITNIGAAAYPIRFTGEIINIATSEKVIDYTSASFNVVGGANVPGRLIGLGKWSNVTDQINRIDAINPGTGDYAAGSVMIVLGHN